MSTHTFSQQLTDALTHLDNELASIRTGRANPALIENLMVLSYGAPTPLQQLASISAPEPRLLVVQPWDPSIIKDIEKALGQSNLGINPVVDGKLIRLPIPAMTEDRRKELLRTVQEQAEATRVRFRLAREEMMKKLKADEKAGTQSEDAVAVAMKQLQQELDEAMESIKQRIDKKTEELMTI